RGVPTQSTRDSRPISSRAPRVPSPPLEEDNLTAFQKDQTKPSSNGGVGPTQSMRVIYGQLPPNDLHSAPAPTPDGRDLSGRGPVTTLRCMRPTSDGVPAPLVSAANYVLAVAWIVLIILLLAALLSRLIGRRFRQNLDLLLRKFVFRHQTVSTGNERQFSWRA